MKADRSATSLQKATTAVSLDRHAKRSLSLSHRSTSDEGMAVGRFSTGPGVGSCGSAVPCVQQGPKVDTPALGTQLRVCHIHEGGCSHHVGHFRELPDRSSEAHRKAESTRCQGTLADKWMPSVIQVYRGNTLICACPLWPLSECCATASQACPCRNPGDRYYLRAPTTTCPHCTSSIICRGQKLGLCI